VHLRLLAGLLVSSVSLLPILWLRLHCLKSPLQLQLLQLLKVKMLLLPVSVCGQALRAPLLLVMR
jgi:hypothetical protein